MKRGVLESSNWIKNCHQRPQKPQIVEFYPNQIKFEFVMFLLRIRKSPTNIHFSTYYS